MSPHQTIRLDVGDQGAAVVDLQHRLEQLGFSTGIDPGGQYQHGNVRGLDMFVKASVAQGCDLLTHVARSSCPVRGHCGHPLVGHA